MAYSDSKAQVAAKSSSRKVLCVLSGVDTLELSHPNMLCAGVIRDLERAKQRAKEAGAPVVLEINGIPFEVLSYGGKNGFDLQARNPDCAIYARSRRCAIESMPSVMVGMRSAWLNADDWTIAYARFEEWSLALLDGGAGDGWQITRVDVFSDFQGWVPALGDVIKAGRRCWSGAGSMKAFPVWAGQRLQTVKIGEGAKRQPIAYQGEQIGKDRIVMRLYDKTAEIVESSGKMWFADLWACREGYDSELPVWRLEFQLRREGLKSFRHAEAPAGIRTVRDLAACYGSLWRYLTGEKIGKSRGFIALRAPTYTKTKPRRLLKRLDQWKLHPAWQAIRNFAVEDEPIRRTGQRHLRAAEALKPGAAGYVSSMLAMQHMGLRGDLGSMARRFARRRSVRERYGKSLARHLAAFWETYVGASLDFESLDTVADDLCAMWEHADALAQPWSPRALRWLRALGKGREGFERASPRDIVFVYLSRIFERLSTERRKARNKRVIEQAVAGLLRAEVIRLVGVEMEWLPLASHVGERAEAKRKARVGFSVVDTTS